MNMKKANPLVSLNVNPCKMCMPMGAVSAFCGIKSCMSMLHGSQGCATYIRRHMATHYNEPVDIASSSLTEHGTVFGGEENLAAGLKNMIELYRPEVIGVCTTCLAETIGEDVGAFVKKFQAENSDVKIISVASPGYGGTQNEGWFAALRAIVEQVAMSEKNASAGSAVNIITPMISPADTRWLKGFLTETGVDFILLPDLSDNLDGVTENPYKRLKTGGTSVSEIAKMAGSAFTIEFSEFTDERNSPAEYLNKNFGVPYVKLPLPVGVRGMERFINALVNLGGIISEERKKERGRYLDAMVDSHKHCAEVRAAIFGEPDFIAAVVRLCSENGAATVLAATGSVSPELKNILKSENVEVIFDDTDFAAIEKICRENDVNLLIGSSDGRRISHKLNIPLIRCSFPIHDFIGGQRTRILGFEGSLFLLDGMANVMLDKKETGFRKELYDKFYTEKTARLLKTARERTESHPCFGENACKNARVHLPVAPKCNIQCNYCLRNFDCMNESRPGVSSKILSPAEAFERYAELKKTIPNLTVAGIAGPGDALANFGETRETLRLIRDFDPDVTFCIATNGLFLPQYVHELKTLNVSHVTVTVNAVNPEIGGKIYKHIDYFGTEFEGEAGAAILLANQLAGIKMLAEAGIVVKVNCVTLKGVNDKHIPEIAKKAASLGAFMTNIMPHIPVKGTVFESLERMTNKEINSLREKCGVDIKQMTHCRQCRSDAVGLLGEDKSIDFSEERKLNISIMPPAPTEYSLQLEIEHKRFAVASKSGLVVDTHFGHAEEFYIYETDGINAKFVETRRVNKYCNGKECEDKIDNWRSVIEALSDCAGVIALRIGITPEMKLKEKGIAAIITYDHVEKAVVNAMKIR